MAFKTREERAALRAKETPYTIDDLSFRGKNIRRGTVKLTSRVRNMDITGATYSGTVERNGEEQTIGVIFSGQRYRDFCAGHLPAEMQAEHERNCEAGNFDAEITREVIIEGFWVPRNWKDAKGNWHKAWDLHAAKWHYKPEAKDTIVEEGCLPFVDAA